MHEQLAALADAARWRIVQLLAERPRSVGVVAELAGLRQPQATKHLQTLERAGLVIARRSGQRRIYALQTEALLSVMAELGRVADLADANRSDRDAFDQYFASVEAETLAADRDRWADERDYVFRRTLAASRDTVWDHLTQPALLAEWWAPADLRLAHVEFGTRPGDRLVQEYSDADDRIGVDGVVGRAEGVVDDVKAAEHLAFRLSPLLPDGTTAFTAHYSYSLADAGAGTDLEVRLRISDSTVPSAEFIAGIQLGWDQCLDKLAATVAASTITSHTITSEEAQ
ncbi:metalloregulator ArsR/SmtB family transcription factor [Agromyces sp. Soil535]|uniref:metalloregulator ArsR/SmtB family transcription factor n=1 Tax=Agromyces sp. Soil535 TaxID=1736390 RepID=UPI0006FDD6F9|nr:metalloregulator ArsR/SmtB family transcription factor [Agromyces sp. Soil535]KRE23437.1 ArsR family transcriptional regulator [Agromyces sp. Soil535]